MLINAIDACPAQLHIWHKLFGRRYTHHAELPEVVDEGENVAETVCNKPAVADPDTGMLARFLPNVRFSA